ncbi:hypothetical protein [Fibrobacter sp.]|uniref:hypothetical protein n=1 Tax=Fibrobacter sp. TaxID=35828 RepID=UPI0025BDAF92|nr:hypothetical protein [Fibrobacter sp.]MBR4006202.1 hypothetical protein [Fibrobacter sp.]
MLNKKLITAGGIALVALAACSSDEPSTAGATVDPNTVAENDSIVFEGGIPVIPELTDLCFAKQGGGATPLCGADEDFTFYSKITAFETEPASLSSDVDSLDIKVYDKEHGAAATCSAGDQSFDAKFRMASSYGYILKTLTMHNVGAACDSILQEFQGACNTNPKIIVQGGYRGFCTSKGDLYAFCADFSHVTMECSEAEADGTKKCHVKRDSSTALDTNRFIQDFVKKSESACTDITAGKLDISDFDPIEDYWTPGHNPIDHIDASEKGEPIDTASFTLEKHAKQFADISAELSFDSSIVAYRILPTSDVVIDTTTTSGLTIKEASPAEVAKYFPMTSAITGNRFNPEHCDIYTIAMSGYLSIASFLTNIEYGQAKFAFIFANGKCKTGDDVAQVFLVKDCTGELDLEPQFDADFIETSPWTCEENGLPPGRENDLYGEWYRADLRQ